MSSPGQGRPGEPEDREPGRVPAGTRVELVLRLLEPGERPAGLPADTARLPYEARVRGTLLQPGRVGEPAVVRTAAGRLVRGRLETVEPGDWHSFGRPVPALVAAIDAITGLREWLR